MAIDHKAFPQPEDQGFDWTRSRVPVQGCKAEYLALPRIRKMIHSVWMKMDTPIIRTVKMLLPSFVKIIKSLSSFIMRHGWYTLLSIPVLKSCSKSTAKN